MNRPGLAIPAFLVLGLAACGRDGPTLHPVQGTVTYKGRPATGAAVHFRRDGDVGPEGAAFPIGLVDADGNFRLRMVDRGEGAPAGKYKVLITWPEPAPAKTLKSADRNGPKSVIDRLQYRYFRPDRPLLEAEVRPETNQLSPFQLTD